MQILLLQLGGQQYALETRQVVRVLPAMRLTALPRAPAFIAGLMNYHGTPVPVLDLGMICAMAGIESDLPPAHEAAPDAIRASAMPPAADDIWFDTRILLVDAAPAEGSTMLLGLRAEHVTGIGHVDSTAVVGSGVADRQSRFLGQVIADGTQMPQLIDVARLLSPEVTGWLRGRMVEAAC